MKKWMKRKNYTAQSKKHLRDKNLQGHRSGMFPGYLMQRPLLSDCVPD